MSESRPTLHLVDGSGYIFRAFFALPQLNNSRGLPTNAVYGFTRMLVKLLKDARPSHLAIVFDSPKRTFRDDLFADYKANRTTPPSDLIVQIPYIHRLVEAFQIKKLMIEGYEADDVIGTLAIRAAKQKFGVTIVTADKDFMQLVSSTITLWDTMRDRRIGMREVREKFGTEPRGVIEIMALMGDSIDNIKGVPGVGEKTATSLIKRFGSVEALYSNLAALETATEIRGAKKLAGIIGQHRADVELARKLVRIETDAPIEVELDAMSYHGIDEKAAAELIRELEFTSLLKELTPSEVKLGQTTGAEVTVTESEIPAAIEELRQAAGLVAHLQEIDSAQVLKLQATGAEKIYVVPSNLIGAMKPVLEAEQPPKTFHDVKTHLRTLGALGISVRGAEFDTMLAGFLVNSGKSEPGIEDLFHEHVAPLGGKMEGSETQIIALLRDALDRKLTEDGLQDAFRRVELPMALVLADMEETGIAIDPEVLRKMSVEFDAQLTQLERECFAAAGRDFNLNSPIQLRDVLFVHLKLPTKGLKKTKSGFSTDVDALTKLAAIHDLPKKLLEYRVLSKLKSTYIDALPKLIDPKTSRIHTSLHQALTATGRLSSTDPNLQNIPTRTEEGRRIRRAFVAKPGSVLLSADYSQIELRILAHLSQDRTLLDAFSSGEDIHTRTAAEVLGVSRDKVDTEARRLAKVINFGIIYGMGPQRLAGELGISLDDAGAYIRRYFERLPGVREYMDRALKEARDNGYVKTMLGRRRYLPELNSPEGGARAQAERIAINTPLQGSAADLIKIAMVRLHERLGKEKARMLLQVHDELLFEVEDRNVPEVAEIVRKEMESADKLDVPLRVELRTGPNWAELRA